MPVHRHVRKVYVPDHGQAQLPQPDLRSIAMPSRSYVQSEKLPVYGSDGSCNDLPAVLEKPASYLSSAGMPYNAVSGHGLSDKPYVHHTLPLSAPCHANDRYVQHRD